MKRGGPSHPKTLDLAARLGLERWGAVGLLESIFHWAGQYARRGDIGRHPPAAIAAGIGWLGEPDKLMRALIDSHWVDECTCHGLKIHDWPDHADQPVHKTKEVLTQGFLKCYKAVGRMELLRRKDSLPHPPAGTGLKAQGIRHKADGTGQTDTTDETIVFAHWVSVLAPRASPNPRARPNSDRLQKVQARLKDYSVEELCLAIDGCKRSAFHQGANPEGRVHKDLELICRDSKRVDMFIEIANGPAPIASQSPLSQHNRRALGLDACDPPAAPALPEGRRT